MKATIWIDDPEETQIKLHNVHSLICLNHTATIRNLARAHLIPAYTTQVAHLINVKHVYCEDDTTTL